MEISKSKAEIIAALQLPNVYLLYRNGELMSSTRRKSANTGTWLAKIERNEEVLIKRVNWRSAEPMLAGGFLEMVKERPDNGELYRLTPLINTLSKRTKEKALKPPKKIVLSDHVKVLAAQYLCSIRYVSIHRWYELSRLDGTKLKNPYIAYTKAGSPVTKLSDMTAEEWQEAIREQSEWVDPCNQNETNTEQADPLVEE